MEIRTECLIIGAGPAGLQFGYFLEKSGRDYLMLEVAETAGSFFEMFPRHEKLLSINKVHTGYEDLEVNLRWDWNSLLNTEGMLFKNYTKDYWPNKGDMVRYLRDFAEYFELKIRYGTKVLNVHKHADCTFSVTDTDGNVYFAKYLVVATGSSKAYIPPIQGIELAENYGTVSIDFEDFAGQRVLIIGKGNSSFETADNLVGAASLIHLVSPGSLKMAWQTHFVGHLRAVNNTILDTYFLKSQNAVLDATVDRITKKGKEFVVSVSYTHANGEMEDLVYDRVINCTGFQFDSSIFDESCMPELAIDDRFPKQTSEWESTNIEGLYFAGTLMQMRDHKKKQSAFIHGFRYNIRNLFRFLEQKYHNKALPHRRVGTTPEKLTYAVIDRINKSSDLWQQFGFLCDLIVIPRDSKNAQYYEGLPVEYIQDHAFGEGDNYYIITLDYGSEHALKDPFNMERVAKDDIDRAQASNFLHPIVRHFSHSKMLSEHHIIEDLAAEWKEDVHVRPLVEFFSNKL